MTGQIILFGIIPSELQSMILSPMLQDIFKKNTQASLQNLSMVTNSLRFKSVRKVLEKTSQKKNKEQIINNQYIRCHGVKQSIPRYYLKKLFPDGLPDEFKQERAQIVQKNKLDKITDYLSNNITGEKNC